MISGYCLYGVFVHLLDMSRLLSLWVFMCVCVCCSVMNWHTEYIPTSYPVRYPCDRLWIHPDQDKAVNEERWMTIEAMNITFIKTCLHFFVLRLSCTVITCSPCSIHLPKPQAHTGIPHIITPIVAYLSTHTYSIWKLFDKSFNTAQNNWVLCPGAMRIWMPCVF